MSKRKSYPPHPSRASRAGWVLPSTLIFVLLAGLVFAQSAQYLLQQDKLRLAQAYARHIERVVAGFDLFVYDNRDRLTQNTALTTARAYEVPSFDANLIRDRVLINTGIGTTADTPHFTVRYYIARRSTAEPVQGILRVTPTANDAGVTAMMIDSLRPSVPGGSPYTLGDGTTAAAQILASIGHRLAADEIAIPSFALSGLNFDYVLREDRQGWFTAGLDQNTQLNMQGNDIIISDQSDQLDAQMIDVDDITPGPIPLGQIFSPLMVEANQLTFQTPSALTLNGAVDILGGLSVIDRMLTNTITTEALLSPQAELHSYLGDDPSQGGDLILNGRSATITTLNIYGALTSRALYSSRPFQTSRPLTTNALFTGNAVFSQGLNTQSINSAWVFALRDISIGSDGTPGNLTVSGGCNGC